MILDRLFKDLGQSLAPSRLVRVLKGPAWVLFITGIVSNIVTILVSLFTLLVYDKVFPHDGVSTLIALTIGTLALMAIDAGMRFLRLAAINHALYATTKEVSIDSLRYRFRELGDGQGKVKKSFFEQAVDDLAKIQPGDVRTATLMVDLPFTLILLIAIALVSGVLVIVPLIAMCIMLIVTIATLQQTKEATLQLDQNKRSAIQSLAHAARGTEWLFGMSGWKWMRDVEMLLTGRVRQSSAELARINNVKQIATQTITQLISIATVFFGFFLFREGMITLGAVIATYILSTRCLSPLGNLAQISSAESKEDSSEEVVESPVHYLSMPSNPSAWELDIQQLQFKYRGKTHPALQIPKLKITQGEKIAILGKSGSGKSTFAKLIVQSLRTSSDAILFSGLPINQMNPEQWEQFCVYVPQVPWFGGGSAFEQIRLGKEGVSDAELGHAVKELGLSDLFSGNTNQSSGDGLSTGQLQLLGLIRCLIRQAPLLILDEPTNSLDSESELKVINAILNRYKDATILLITHKKSLIAHMNRALVFDAGQLVRDVPIEKAPA